MPLFESSVVLRARREEVFEFLLRPANVREISDPSTGLSFVEAPEVVATGDRLDFKVQHMGVVQELTHEITVVERPRYIQERQVKGPLKQWVHEHLFEETAAGHAVVIDRIEFEPPAGLVGLLMNAERILESLDEGFDYRHMQLERLFGKGERSE